MRQLFLFFYNYRAFFTFLFLEAICGWLIIENNQYQSSAFFNSANSSVASILQFQNNITDYFKLKNVNKDLAYENALLKAKLEQLKLSDSLAVDSALTPEVINQFEFTVAKVINNTTRNVYNYITINKGTNDGIKPGMGVIGPRGVVGKIKTCSGNFSTITSVLHFDNLISSKLKKNGAFCTTKWNGKNPRTANLIYLPKHIKVAKGDTVVTSGFNAVFPDNVMIGIVSNVRGDLQVEDVNRITINLSTDFNGISYLYVVNNKLKPQLDSLKIKTGMENE